MSGCRFSLLLAVFLATVASCRANDGALSLGGTPRLMSSHKTVSMQSEVIRMTVGEETVTVDCRFVFRNVGPACTVRMGFPDQGRGDVPGADGADFVNKKKPIKTSFQSFASYVNGRKTATKILRGAGMGEYWHVKMVRFPAKSVVRVRDVYTQPVGAQITSGRSVLSQVSYILRTGASWKGTIGSTDIFVMFQRKRPASPLRPAGLKRGQEDKTLFETDWTGDAHRVYWRGFAAPTVQGNTLHFRRRNWRPTDRSDLYLAFDNRGPGTESAKP